MGYRIVGHIGAPESAHTKRRRSSSEGRKAPSYLRWLRTLPSVISGLTVNIEAHHLLESRTRSFGKKPWDRECIPLTQEEHWHLHNAPMHERDWLEAHGVSDGPALAAQLWTIWRGWKDDQYSDEWRDDLAEATLTKARQG